MRSLVRPATIEDAARAVEVLRLSITEICVDDHRNDAATLERWLSNKQADIFERWLADLENDVVVAESDGNLTGVGLIYRRSEIRLCYMRPGFQGRGVGRALLSALEDRAVHTGSKEIRLTSTGNARPFYERCGYHSTGEGKIVFGVLVGYPYQKTL